MEQEIKVSVFCNVFNHGKYIRDALEGFVCQQTDFPFEVLIHDDASTDDSAAIIREYEEKYPDIIKPIYQTENQYSQRIPIYITHQIPRAKGKYYAMCEGDDYWTDPLKLQKQYDFMEAHPEYSLCACSTCWLNVRTGIIENKTQTPEDTDISLEAIIQGQRDQLFQYASIFIKADVYKQYPLWRRTFPVGDYSVMLLAALNGKVRMLADEMTVYRYYAENSWTVRMDNEESRARINERMIEAFAAFDEATEYRYHDLVNKRILVYKYSLALMRHDYEALRSDELKEMFQSRRLVYRISDVLRCKYPGLYGKMKPLAKRMRSNYDKK